MAKVHLCQYGNCEETNTPIRVTTKENRVLFCCNDHAAMWLLSEGRSMTHASRECLIDAIERNNQMNMTLSKKLKTGAQNG
jgi:hypothetical protein